MKYFKLIKDRVTFIGIATTDDFRKFQIKHSILLACKEDDAQYINCDNNLYRDTWLAPLNNNIITYETSEIIEITKEEYDELYEMIERDEEITPEPEPQPEPIPDPEEEDITVDYAKTLKIREMSYTCENLIYAGIDVILSDESLLKSSIPTLSVRVIVGAYVYKAKFLTWMLLSMSNSVIS